MKTILHVSSGIRARPADVFRALTFAEELASWWTTHVDGDAGAGGVVKFTFDGDFDPSMRVDRSEPSSAVEWTGVEVWPSGRTTPSASSSRARDGTTRLRFRQDYATELSDDDYGISNYNWGYYLGSLA